MERATYVRSVGAHRAPDAKQVRATSPFSAATGRG
jgi:hypothetical protein